MGIHQACAEDLHVGVIMDGNGRWARARGLPRPREAWVRERGGVEAYDGRAVKPEDNGNVSGRLAARDFPNKPQPMRAVTFAAALPSPSRGGWPHMWLAGLCP